MSFNTFGNFFKITTFGESHGKALGVIVDGIPSNIPINIEQDIQYFVNLRRPGKNIYVSPRAEKDKVEIISGLFEGKTLGTPIAMLIHNNDCNSQDYETIKNSFRPNHGDYTWEKKFGIRDHRGGGRSSARETVARVAAGALARKILKYHNIDIIGSVVQIGNIGIDYNNWDYSTIKQNPFFCADVSIIPKWENLLLEIKNSKDSIGAKVELHALGVPVGLGEPVFNKLDANIAQSIMSIPAVKSVEIGIGSDAVKSKGSEINDEMYIKNNQVAFKSNHSGGILGGISNGEPIVVKFTVKPTSSISIAKKTVNRDLKEVEIITKGRHDPCVGIRAVPVGEAMLAIVLLDNLLMHYARNNIFNT